MCAKMTHLDFSRIICKLPEPLLLVERDGRVVAANSGASKLFRRRSSDLVGMPLIALIDGDTGQKPTAPAGTAILGGGPANI